MPTASETAIETHDLSKSFGDVHAVSDLNLSVARGECYAFLGRNGSGKSTTARLLLDFIRPTSGSYHILGGSGADAEVRGKIGYLPGDLNMPRTMTVEDAFDYYGRLAGAAPNSADPLVERFPLDTRRKVRELSTGDRRKVGLILAFMPDPELLVLDEPTSGLDPVLQDEFRTLLSERKAGGATIWLTSHVMAEVERVADRVGLINKGRLAKEVTMETLKHESVGSIRLTFPEPPATDAFAGIDSVGAITTAGNDMQFDVDGPVAPILSRAGELGATRIETVQRDLDEVFVELYEQDERGEEST
jgi:ABC-2 type transport system ATP-binding protein